MRKVNWQLLDQPIHLNKLKIRTSSTNLPQSNQWYLNVHNNNLYFLRRCWISSLPSGYYVSNGHHGHCSSSDESENYLWFWVKYVTRNVVFDAWTALSLIRISKWNYKCVPYLPTTHRLLQHTVPLMWFLPMLVTINWWFPQDPLIKNKIKHMKRVC